MHRNFFGDGWPVFQGIRVGSGKAIEFERGFAEIDKQLHLKSACDHRLSWLLVQEALVLLILLIL
ncbi:MAG: hypothetical protein OXU26_13520, partial [Acidobacteriota bacterium]|nr:hypothetical protein [Acidobacteriota bacterium]